MPGKWVIIGKDGQPTGKATLFAPSEIAQDERVTYVEELRVSSAKGNVIEVVKNEVSRGTAKVHARVTYVEVNIYIVADSPQLAQSILDQLLDKAGVRHAYSFEEK